MLHVFAPTGAAAKRRKRSRDAKAAAAAAPLQYSPPGENDPQDEIDEIVAAIDEALAGNEDALA